jgi:hypothetical protein
MYYNTTMKAPDFVINDIWIVLSVSGDRVVLNKNANGTMSIMSPFKASDLYIEGTASAPAEPETPTTTTTDRTYVV